MGMINLGGMTEFEGTEMYTQLGYYIVAPHQQIAPNNQMSYYWGINKSALIPISPGKTYHKMNPSIGATVFYSIKKTNGINPPVYRFFISTDGNNSNYVGNATLNSNVITWQGELRSTAFGNMIFDFSHGEVVNGGKIYSGIRSIDLTPLSRYSNVKSSVNGLATELDNEMNYLVGKENINPNVTPPYVPIPQPGAGSFATQSIDNVTDLLNFCKGAAVVLLGSSINPASIIPANIIVGISFVYAVRNHILKFTSKITIHGHK
jgi:hypothetical protein